MWAYLALAVVLILIIICFTFAFQPQNVQQMDPIPENTFSFPVHIINLDRNPERYEYVTKQLDTLGITDYSRISAMDGFKADPQEMIKLGIDTEFVHKERGAAGCAASHVKTWRQIADNKSGWTLILEDDAHFHPDFVKLFSKYWNKVPRDASIIYPGYSCDNINETLPLIVSESVLCTHAYIINWQGAERLLNNIPKKTGIDIEIANYFRHKTGSYIFNGTSIVEGIRPYDYKEANGRKCTFNGIIYQNQQDYGNTTKAEHTTF